ncbi:MAG: hypothetical protein IKK94_08125 [Clostridia bacterium]|nr:hypothetical protein [Clostridia bacterium]
MKKILFLVVSLLLCSMMLVSAFAAEYEMIGELYEKWTTEGYPEYVTGVWSTYGDMSHLTIGIIDGEEGENGKAEILALIENDSSVNFTTQKYSRNYLVGIMDELDGYIKKGLAFSCGGVYEIENVVKLTLLEDHMDDEVSEAVKLEMQEKYGDAVAFDYGEGIITEDLIAPIDLGPVKELIESGNVHIYYTDIESTPEKSNKTFYIVLVTALTLALGMPVFFFRKNRLMKTTNGEVVSEAPLCDKEIENMIKDSDPQYPTELDEKISKIIVNRNK